MKLEYILGSILLAVLIVIGGVYAFGNKMAGPAPFTIPELGHTEATSTVFLTPDQKKQQLTLAPDISTPDGFVNTLGKPISLASLKGKVVLLDIWTYSCINCQRTIPYLNEWYKKYKDAGLEIVGLHTPEFSFEKIQKNVEMAVKERGIMYPVVLDNDFSTWNAYGNQYWPRKYLIDMDGYIIYDHIGEGGYEDTEKAIQYALKERSARLGIKTDISTSIATPAAVIPVDVKNVASPEIYFGSKRNDQFVNGKNGVNGDQTLKIPDFTFDNQLYLEGLWSFSPEYSVNKGKARILFKYNAKNVYMVASSPKGVDVRILVDGKVTGTVHINEEKLYTLVQGADYGAHRLEIEIPEGGELDAFTFTFG